MELNEVIQRIGYFRNKLNLSARELSLRIGKHEGYINKLESKDFNLPTTMLLEIINALEIEPSECKVIRGLVKAVSIFMSFKKNPFILYT